MPSDRELYILSLESRVLRIARAMVRNKPARLQWMEDFIQVGWVGAINAVDKHHKGHFGALRQLEDSQRYSRLHA